MAVSGAFTELNLFDNDELNVQAGVPAKVGEYQIQAGELVCLGYGMQSGQDSAQGRVFADFKNNASTPAGIDGRVRVSVWGPQDNFIKHIKEWRTEELRTVKDDRTKQVPFPEQMDYISEDKKIILEFIPDANGVLSKANSDLLMNITREYI